MRAASNFIRQYGLKKAHRVVNLSFQDIGYPFYSEHLPFGKTTKAGWHTDYKKGCIHISDLKALIRTYEQIEALGGIKRAKDALRNAQHGSPYIRYGAKITINENLTNIGMGIYRDDLEKTIACFVKYLSKGKVRHV